MLQEIANEEIKEEEERKREDKKEQERIKRIKLERRLDDLSGVVAKDVLDEVLHDIVNEEKLKDLLAKEFGENITEEVINEVIQEILKEEKEKGKKEIKRQRDAFIKRREERKRIKKIEDFTLKNQKKRKERIDKVVKDFINKLNNKRKNTKEEKKEIDKQIKRANLLKSRENARLNRIKELTERNTRLRREQLKKDVLLALRKQAGPPKLSPAKKLILAEMNVEFTKLQKEQNSISIRKSRALQQSRNVDLQQAEKEESVIDKKIEDLLNKFKNL